MTPEDAQSLFHMAANNAMIYGVGIIKLINTPTGITVEVISPDEYLQTSESLKWASEHMVVPKTQ